MPLDLGLGQQGGGGVMLDNPEQSRLLFVHHC